MTVQFATWDKQYIPNADAPYWTTEWKKIFIANMVLENLDRVEGSIETKEQLRAEAHFIRAYSYFKLADVYCLPYNQSTKNEMGLPIKKSTSFEEPIERASLESTWDMMKEDMEIALTLEKEFGTFQGQKKIWRASTVSVNAFAARFYLTLNDYEKAEEYADLALSEYSYLRNYNTDMRYSDLPTQVTIFNPEPENVDILYPYTHDQQNIPTDKFEWGESYYYRFLTNGSWNYYPSQELLNLYDQDNDLRYKYHIVENYSYARGIVDPPYSQPGYIFFFKSDILSGPSVPEMLLIKAEAQTRQGRWNEGLTTVNILRNARMDQSAPSTLIQLNATTQDEALVKILEERRREMPFVSRWHDVRRYNNNETGIDDVEMTKIFYPYNASIILKNDAPILYTLEKNSRRFANPIPEQELLTSDWIIKQNTY